MAIKGTIAEGFIKIIMQGWNEAKAALSKIQAQVQKLGETFSSIGSVSGRAFAITTGSMLGFLKAADPTRMTIFTQRLMILSMHIGSIFIPLLIKATKVLDNLILFFKNLTPHQQAMIRRWTEIALAVLGVGMAIGILGKALTTLIVVIRTLTAAIGILEVATGVGVVLAVLALALTIYELYKNSKTLEPVLNALENAWDTFCSAMKPVFDLFKKIGAEGEGVFKPMFKALTPILQACVHVLEKLIQPLTRIMTSFLEMFRVYRATGAKMWENLTSNSTKLIPLIQKFGHYCEDAFDRLQKIIKKVQPAIESLIKELGELWEVIGSFLIEVLGDLIEELMGVGDGFLEVFGEGLLATIKIVVAAIREIIREIKAAVTAAKTMYEIYKAIEEERRNSLDRLNPFTSGSREDRKKAEEDRLLREGNAQTKRDIEKMHEEAKKKKEEEAQKALPMYQKPEFVGLEDAFKRAQVGAAYDPNKEYQKAFIENQKIGNDKLGQLVDQTKRPPMAEAIR